MTCPNGNGKLKSVNESAEEYMDPELTSVESLSKRGVQAKGVSEEAPTCIAVETPSSELTVKESRNEMKYDDFHPGFEPIYDLDTSRSVFLLHARARQLTKVVKVSESATAVGTRPSGTFMQTIILEQHGISE